MDYPRMLYQGGDRDADYVIVNDEAEEATQRKAGYAYLREVEPKAKSGKTEPKAK